MIKVPRDITYPPKIKKNKKKRKKKQTKKREIRTKKNVCSAKGEVFSYVQ